MCANCLWNPDCPFACFVAVRFCMDIWYPLANVLWYPWLLQTIYLSPSLSWYSFWLFLLDFCDRAEDWNSLDINFCFHILNNKSNSVHLVIRDQVNMIDNKADHLFFFFLPNLSGFSVNSILTLMINYLVMTIVHHLAPITYSRQVFIYFFNFIYLTKRSKYIYILVLFWGSILSHCLC